MIYDPIFKKIEKQIWEEENSEDPEESGGDYGQY